MAISKIVYKSSPNATPVTWMDATTATAAAANIISPYTAMLADGVMTTGTGSGGGGGPSYSSGSFTPSSNTLTQTFDIEDSSYTHFMVWANSNPYGNGVRTAALGFVDFANNRQYVISSNSSGASAAGNIQWTYSATAFCFSKSGSTVTLNSTGSNSAHMNYLISGITYNWVAW